MLRFRRTLSSVSLAFALLAGCGGDGGEPGDGDTCGVGHCACTASECACPDGGGECSRDCDSACVFECLEGNDCDFVCGDGCLAQCSGSGACQVDVGTGSTVVCAGAGGCDVSCHGDCSVMCPGGGECRVACDAGFSCYLESCSAMTCADGLQVCNGACP